MVALAQQQVRSPLNWVGGKYYSAKKIVGMFPRPDTYDCFVDVFGGAAHVTFAKPLYKHLEVYNDLNGDLVNFWIQCRDNAEALQARLDTLPYARDLHYIYRDSLRNGEVLDDLERAVRWFYRNRSAFAGDHSWGYSTLSRYDHSVVHAFKSSIALLQVVSERFRYIQIDNRDFAKIITAYAGTRSFFYCDPPYIGAEHYYKPPFTQTDHERLSVLLNTTSAMVALSYYDHPLLDTLYPVPKWRRVTWDTNKCAEKTSGKRQHGHEVLLMNYAPPSLWEDM